MLVRNLSVCVCVCVCVCTQPTQCSHPSLRRCSHNSNKRPPCTALWVGKREAWRRFTRENRKERMTGRRKGKEVKAKSWVFFFLLFFVLIHCTVVLFEENYILDSSKNHLKVRRVCRRRARMDPAGKMNYISSQ